MIGKPRFRSGFLIFTFLLPCVLLNRSLNAQPSPTREDLNALQKQINDLKDSQKTLQKELQEIKALLQGRAAQPNLPPPNLTVSFDNLRFKGNKEAKIALIEFSDYQCPFCARFFTETLPQIEKEYISAGKLKYVIRDFPLEAIHPHAFKAHEAANCAGEQGKYWEMHDRLFQNQNLLGAAELPKHAQAIGLETAEFEACLRSGKQAAEIRKDLADGQNAGVHGTPTFFLGVGDSDTRAIKVLRMIVGAQPYAQFKETIEEVLREIKK